MEKLARTLSVIQQGMLRNNPGDVKDSVNEASEVLSGMLNTHKCLLESNGRWWRRKRRKKRLEEESGSCVLCAGTQNKGEVSEAFSGRQVG